MIVSSNEVLYEIKIIAIESEPKNYLIEVNGRGFKEVHFTVGPNNSLRNTVARIVKRIETTQNETE